MKSKCKETIFKLLLTEENGRIVSNQLLEIVKIISKDDFPHDWLDKLKIYMKANEIGVLRIFHAMFKKFRYELATYQLWQEIESSTAVANLLTDLLMRFMFNYKPNRISGEQFQKLLLTVKIIQSLSFHDLPEEFAKELPLIMNVFYTILCLPISVSSNLLLISFIVIYCYY